ncbi:adenylate cyclase [Saccharomycopsis crataegensis]|uniref:Adenylate cyclase n=1 Tax=Saccharomycopsis crataegensis TaxID=43959 RepID=A0AAV5QM26_9ASCO|nr:adenylate cyclase [Saccharomycopsis crataegensis]
MSNQHQPPSNGGRSIAGDNNDLSPLSTGINSTPETFSDSTSDSTIIFDTTNHPGIDTMITTSPERIGVANNAHNSKKPSTGSDETGSGKYAPHKALRSSIRKTASHLFLRGKAETDEISENLESQKSPISPIMRDVGEDSSDQQPPAITDQEQQHHYTLLGQSHLHQHLHQHLQQHHLQQPHLLRGQQLFHNHQQHPETDAQLPQQNSLTADAHDDQKTLMGGIPKNYKGFHAPRSPIVNTPPFKSPVKPSYKKTSRKKGSLFNKFISSRKASESSNDSYNDGDHGLIIHTTGESTKPPSISPSKLSFDHHHNEDDEVPYKARQNSNSSAVSSRSHHLSRKGIFNLYPSSRLKSISSERSVSSVSNVSDQTAPTSIVNGGSKPTSFFDIELNLDSESMAGVVNSEFSSNDVSARNSISSPRSATSKVSPRTNPLRSASVVSNNFLDNTLLNDSSANGLKDNRNYSVGNGSTSSTKWTAPESWAVKQDVDKINQRKNHHHLDKPGSNALELSLYDDDDEDANRFTYTAASSLFRASGKPMPTTTAKVSEINRSPTSLDESTDPLSTTGTELNHDGYYHNKHQASVSKQASPKKEHHKNDGVSFQNYVMKPKSHPHGNSSSNNNTEPKSNHDKTDIERNKSLIVNQYPMYHQKDKSLPDMMKTLKSMTGNYILRVFREDNTFTTISASIDATVAEILLICKKKFFLQSAVNFQIVFKIGKSSKVLEPEDRPLQIQCFMLLLAGYDEKRDDLSIVGREDITYICKFVLENNDFQPFVEEDEHLKTTRDYASVKLINMDLHAIPLVFFQHTYEIEELDVSQNPSIMLPADFINSCNNLRKIAFANNRANRFPHSLLEAKKLTRLNVENNLIRTIPEKLGCLVYLTKLFLNGNNISKLPKSISNLKNLKILNLSSNNFEIFPEPVTALDELVVLDLSFNQIETISQSITNLKNLEELNMATNCLSGVLPSYLSDLLKVKVFYIQYNNITNFDCAGLMKNLEVLYASKNNVSRFQFQASNLRIFLFDRNPVIEIPFNNVSLNCLTTLNLSKAKLTAFNNDDLSSLINLETLYLDKNDLTYLPTEIGSLKKLVYLSAYSNNLQSIPNSIGELRNLRYLDVHSNNIKGVPDSIWSCSLTRLNLSSNLLQNFPAHPTSNKSSMPSSRINSRKPSVISDTAVGSTSSVDSSGSLNMQIIQEHPFRDRSNSLTPFSYSATGLMLSDLALSLQVLSVADNRLTDECFEPISTLCGLKTLNLSYNELIEIPNGTLRRLCQLHELYLSGNELSNLPGEDFATLKYLEVLHINGNKIHSLPYDISKLRTLSVFDVGSNHLKYNISNFHYEWNWQWNLELRYLNFSGNKRLEISRQYTHTGYNKAIDNIKFDSFMGLKKLRVLGLIDVTLKNSESSLPDESINTRVRTTASEIYNYKYGIADTLGQRENISTREIMYNNFRGHEDELLICLFDGKNDDMITKKHGNKITQLIQEVFKNLFTEELRKMTGDDTVEDCMRRSFLALNREINNYWQQNNEAASKESNDPFRLSEEDILSGCSITIVYIKGRELYAGNIGDSSGLISKTNGEHEMLTDRHDPTNRKEFERIRLCGGYVSGKGELDGVTNVSRAAGFLNLLPHINASPNIKAVKLGTSDEMLVIATSELWEYVSNETAVDVINHNQSKKDPMWAAQRLRDFAIAYGARDKMTVIVLTLGNKKRGNLSRKTGSRISITEESLLPIKKRRDRLFDSNLNRMGEEISPPEGSVAMVFTDIKNSTLLWDTYPSAMRSAIKTHNFIMRRLLRIVGGYEVKTEGDAFMVSFPTPISALIWCCNVQLQLLSMDWPLEILESSQCCEINDSKNEIIYRGLSVRMGIHWGSPVCEPDAITGRMDYFGPMVNRASRVSSVADGGQISISNDYLKELHKLLEIHEKSKNGEKTIKEAYGDVQVGMILENEMDTLDTIGYVIKEIGEKKLKGLETPEFISLVFPSKLQERANFMLTEGGAQDVDAMSRHSSGILGGLISQQSLCQLEMYAIKLEHICSIITAGTTLNVDILAKSKQAEEELLRKIRNPNITTEQDHLMLLDNVVTRIENATSMIKFHQVLTQAIGEKNEENASVYIALAELKVHDMVKALKN